MQRTPLAGLVLSILSLGLGPPGPFLARALQPPSADAVEESCRSLRLAGALDAADALTPLGAHLARMPLDVRVGKMHGAVRCAPRLHRSDAHHRRGALDAPVALPDAL